MTYFTLFGYYIPTGDLLPDFPYMSNTEGDTGNTQAHFSSAWYLPEAPNRQSEADGLNPHLCHATGSHLLSNKVQRKLERVQVPMLWVLLGNPITWVWS